MEMTLNLSLRECLLRGLGTLLIPFALALINPRLIPFFLPVILYLYITAIIHRCPVKHWWRKAESKADDNNNLFWDKDENP